MARSKIKSKQEIARQEEFEREQHRLTVLSELREERQLAIQNDSTIDPATGMPINKMDLRLKKTLQIFHELADSISNEEFLAMTPGKKIAALRDLNVILTSGKAMAPRNVVLANFNFDKAKDAKEVEQILNSFADEQQEAAE